MLRTRHSRSLKFRVGGESNKSLRFVVFNEKLGRKVGLDDLNAKGREGRKTWWGTAIDGVRVLASALVAKPF